MLRYYTDMSITLGDALNLTYGARNEWKSILLSMKVDSAIIDSIGVKYRDDPDNCYREGLNVWLKHGKRSWGDVVEALRSPSVNHTTIAQDIEIYQKKETEQQAAASSQVKNLVIMVVYTYYIIMFCCHLVCEG